MLMRFISHSKYQNLPLAIGLYNLYQQIKLNVNQQQIGIKYIDFTNYICQKISQKDPDLIIPYLHLPNQKMEPNIEHIRQIDINPPIVYNISILQCNLPKITKQNLNKKIDKKLYSNKNIQKFIYSNNNKVIIVLSRLASQIGIYDLKLNYKGTIQPKNDNFNKDILCFKKSISILSFAYSQKYQRIGAIIKNMGIIFWDLNDKSKTQKLIKKFVGDKIYYLQLLSQWITTDQNTLYFWDLQQQKLKRSIRKNQAVQICDICQIQHLRAICVAYVLEKEVLANISISKLQGAKTINIQTSKWLFIYHNNQTISKLQLNYSGCHSLHYNKQTQVLIPLGYKSSISVYQIDKKTYDLNLKYELIGHTSIITCITSIEQTTMCITGDDKGYIRIWQLGYMRCLQVIKLANCLKYISFCYQNQNNYLIYGDTRINIIKMQKINKISIQQHQINVQSHSNQNYGQVNYGIYHFINRQKSYIITRKNCQVICLKTGKIKQIYILCNQANSQQITSILQTGDGFLIGTSKGQLQKYNFEGQNLWKIQAHQHDIISIYMDKQNLKKIIITICINGSIKFWINPSVKLFIQYKYLINSPQRQLQTSKNIDQQNIGKQISLIKISINFKIIITIIQKDIYFWDYQSLKYCNKIKQKDIPIILKISQLDPLFLIGYQKYIEIYSYQKQSLSLIISCQNLCQICIKDILPLSFGQFNSNISNASQITMLSTNQFDQQCNSVNTLTAQLIQRYSQQSQIIDTIFQMDNNQTVIILITFGKGWVIYYQIPSLLEKKQKVAQRINKKYRKVSKNTKYNSFQSKKLSKCLRNSIQKKKHHNTQSIFKRSSFLSPTEFINQQIQSGILQWYKKIHKNQITAIKLQKKDQYYVHTLSNDGYYKICTLKVCQTICSMNLKYPLPILWKQIPKNIQQLKKQIYNVLIILNNILKDSKNNLTQKDKQIINVKDFIKEMSKNNSIDQDIQIKHQGNQIPLMKDQYHIQGINREDHKSISLKFLQAEKRVRLIKQKESSLKKLPNSQLNTLQSSKKQKKQQIFQFFKQKFNTTQQLSGNQLTDTYFKKLKNYLKSTDDQSKIVSINEFKGRQNNLENPLSSNKFKRGKSHNYNDIKKSLSHNQEPLKNYNNNVRLFMKQINKKLTSYKKGIKSGSIYFKNSKA